MGHQFIMIDLDDEWDAMGEAASGQAERAKSGSDRVAAALQRQLDDIRRIKISRVRRKRRARRMLDPLINWQNRDVTAAAQTSAVVNLLQAADDPRIAIAAQPNPFGEIRARQRQGFARDRFAAVVQQIISVGAKVLCDRVDANFGGCDCHGYILLSLKLISIISARGAFFRIAGLFARVTLQLQYAPWTESILTPHCCDSCAKQPRRATPSAANSF